MPAIVIIEAVAIALLGLMVVGLLRSHAEILRRLHGLGAGMSYDTVDLTDPVRTADGPPDEQSAMDIGGHVPGGGAVVVSTSQGPTLLAFMSSGCAVCADFWEAFADSGGLSLPGASTRLVIVAKGPEAESEAALAKLAPEAVTTVMSSQAWEDYAVPVSPFFVLVEDGTVVGEGAARTWPQVLSLLSQATEDSGLAGRGTADRLRSAEAELAAAGIGPGHASLHPERRAEG